MRKSTLKFFQLLAVGAALALPMQSAADVLLNDSFDYSVGNLYGQGNWLKVKASGDVPTLNPLQVVNAPLTFAGYQDAAVGKAVKSDAGDVKSQSLHSKFADEVITSGTLYYSLLVKPESVAGTSKVVISGLVTKTSSQELGDGTGNTSFYNTVSLTAASEGKFQFGFASSTSKPTLVEQEYACGETYLVVFGYDFSTKNMSFWVNPTVNDASNPTATLSGGSISNTLGVQGVSIVQGTVSSLATGVYTVDEVRVATTFAELFTQSTAGGEEPGVEASLEVTPEKLFNDVAAPINQTVEFAKFTVNAANLPAPIPVDIRGTNRTFFSANLTEIPAGTGTYEVLVSYHPTAIGTHKANVAFETDLPGVSSLYSLTAAAYDPDNLPEITVPTETEEFNVTVGESVVKRFNVSSKNMFAYGTLTVTQSVPGTFILNNASLYPNIDAQFSLTFKPQVAGEYTATITVSAPMAESKTITFRGVCTGTAETPDTEGNELNLDTTNPLTYLFEHFDGVTHNKPLELEGWNNVAVVGQRAWWGYLDPNDANNGAAKVTAYDSKAETETPCEMLLVTPALDFKNAATKVLTFRVMGKLLAENGVADILDVVYIDEDGGVQSLGEIGVPATADYNDEWIDFVVDFDGQELTDVFFIGFKFASTRGTLYTHSYYIDDVSWGRTDVPQVKSPAAGVTMEAFVGQTAESAAVEVNGYNLTEDIAVSIVGDNASNFTPSVATLPSTGGQVSVFFTPEEVGWYMAYIQLSSAGAPTYWIPIVAEGRKDDTAIEGITSDSEGEVRYFNLQGVEVKNPVAGTIVIRVIGDKVTKLLVK